MLEKSILFIGKILYLYIVFYGDAQPMVLFLCVTHMAISGLTPGFAFMNQSLLVVLWEPYMVWWIEPSIMQGKNLALCTISLTNFLVLKQ